MALIELKHIGRAYTMGGETLHALKDINLGIGKNEYVAFIGASGSGKSTLMNILGCLDTPSTGEYHLNGELVSSKSNKELARVRNREIGFIFQSFNLLPRASALKNVMQPLIYAKVGLRERARRAQAMLEQVGLGERSTTCPTNSPAGSVSGWPLPAPWSPGLPSCSPTNRPVTSTVKPRTTSWPCFKTCTTKAKPSSW